MENLSFLLPILAGRSRKTFVASGSGFLSPTRDNRFARSAREDRKQQTQALHRFWGRLQPDFIDVLFVMFPLFFPV